MTSLGVLQLWSILWNPPLVVFPEQSHHFFHLEWKGKWRGGDDLWQAERRDLNVSRRWQDEGKLLLELFGNVRFGGKDASSLGVLWRRRELEGTVRQYQP